MSDKDMVAHEVGLDAGAQDERDMERMGKVQEFKVSPKMWGMRSSALTQL
jgi:hypothetical protein